MISRLSIALPVVLASAVAGAQPASSSKEGAKEPPRPAPAATAAATPAAKAGPGTQAVKTANETIAALLKQKVAPGSKEEKDLAAKVTTSVRGFLDID